MASFIENGESIFIPFRNERSISDSQMKPRMYKTIQAFEKSFPKHYLGMDGVELVEYAPVVHGRWLPYYEELERVSDIEPYFVVEYVQTGWECSVCGRCESHDVVEMPYCHCGAKMNKEEA